jgi:hypothetical protein
MLQETAHSNIPGLRGIAFARAGVNAGSRTKSHRDCKTIFPTRRPRLTKGIHLPTTQRKADCHGRLLYNDYRLKAASPSDASVTAFSRANAGAMP